MGHPQIITENFADISTYFGLIKCTILPPRGLLHPVLPYRTKENLMFPLCKTCADTKNPNPCTHTDQERAIRGTWCHIEVMKAIEKGYVVLNLHEVWHWEETSDELFKEYVDTFLKIKQEASCYPQWCVTDEQKQRYIDAYYEHEGIRLDPDKIEYNPGLRYLAKLMLNSLWGKLLFHNSLTLVSSVGRAWDCSEKNSRFPFGFLRSPVLPFGLPFGFRNEGFTHFYFFIGKFAQRCNLTKTDRVTEPKELYHYLDSDEYDVRGGQLVNDETFEIQYMENEGFVVDNDKVNIVIAAFTTAYARLKLYDLLDLLQERVLYYDTDSVVYVHEPGKPDPPLGDYLGDLTDELNGGYITTFLSGGPKNYAYITNTGEGIQKIRGLSLTYDARKTLNIGTMRDLVESYVVDGARNEKVTINIPNKITRDKKEKQIVTKRTKKDYRVVYNKRVVKENYETVPYGY